MIGGEGYEFIRPIGSERPKIYGLPKIHKPDIPFTIYSTHMPFCKTFNGEMVNSSTQSCFSILFRILCV